MVFDPPQSTRRKMARLLCFCLAPLLLQSGCLSLFGKKGAAENEKPDTEQEVAETGLLQGTVTYLQRIALPPSAVVELSLTRRNKTGIVEVLSHKIPRPGQVPIEFELEVPAIDYSAGNQYFISAQIAVDDELLFASETPVRIFEQGSPCHVQLILKPPRQNPPSSETEK